jgi:hypothetical protein
MQRSVGGDRPIGLVVAVVVVGFFVVLPALIVPAYYLFANVTAIVTGTDFDSNHVNIAVFLTGMCIIVASMLVVMVVAVNLIGRALSPKRRKDA